MNEHHSSTPPQIEGIITKPSSFSAKRLVERLKEILQSRGLDLFAHINHSEEARRVGLEMQEAHVLIFGNPKAGTPLMIASPLLALELPLRVLVWQGSDGRTWVSYASSEYLAARYSIPHELIGNIAGIDGVVDSALRDQS
jgi:uncharacterized protein (DUF302 family)